MSEGGNNEIYFQDRLFGRVNRTCSRLNRPFQWMNIDQYTLSIYLSVCITVYLYIYLLSINLSFYVYKHHYDGNQSHSCLIKKFANYNDQDNMLIVINSFDTITIQWLTSSMVLHLTHMVTLTDLLIPAPQHRARC